MANLMVIQNIRLCVTALKKCLKNATNVNADTQLSKMTTPSTFFEKKGFFFLLFFFDFFFFFFFFADFFYAMFAITFHPSMLAGSLWSYFPFLTPVPSAFSLSALSFLTLRASLIPMNLVLRFWARR